IVSPLALLPGQLAMHDVPERLTLKNRIVRRSRVAAGDATCLSKPAAHGLLSGLFGPVLRMAGGNGTVGDSCSIAPASGNSSSSFKQALIRAPRFLLLSDEV